MAAVRGVENNESSRFIDYTLATPWETLISDIEKALKLLTKNGTKAELLYLDMPFTMEKLKTNSVRNKKDISKSLSIQDPLWLSKSFNTRTFILFSATGPYFADYIPSAKTSILSAFVTAVKASPFFNIPVFFTYDIVADIGQIKELIGFQMFKKITQDRDIVRFCRYESYLHDKLSSKNELYYFDGLRKIFKKKLANSGTPLSGEAAQYALNPDNYRITAVNSYLYRVADFRSLILENYLFMMMQQAQQAVSGGPSATSRVVFSSDFNRLLMSMCSTNHTRSLHLSHLLVKLQYREQKQSAVIDNDSYTTFIPSKQPPSSWKVSSYFKIQSHGHGKATSGGGATDTSASAASINTPQNPEALPSTACWMVFCLRKLLVMYIASAFNRREDLATMDKLAGGGKYTNGDLLDRATVDRIIVMLSVESQATLRAVFPGLASPVPDGLPSQLSREKSNSNPTLFTAGEEWLDFELREQIEDIKGFLFETEEHKEARTRANLAATRGALSSSTEDYAPYSNQGSSYGAASPTTTSNNNSTSSPRKPNLTEMFSAALSSGTAIGGATSSSSSTCTDEAQSDSVGYFVSLLAVLASCMGGSGVGGQNEIYAVAKLWSSVLKETHNSWELGNTLQTFSQPESEGSAQGGSFDYSTENMYNTGRSSSTNSSSGAPPSVLPTPPRHQYGTYAKYLTSSANQTSVLVGDEGRLPICSRDLWQDLIDKKRVRDGLSLSLPNRGESIVVQKMQMLQFCIAMKNESVIYRFRNNVSPTPRDNANNGEPRSIISPRLYRRLPLTEDTIAMQERISARVSNDTSSSGKEHPLLKWQVVRPALISDVNAFKAANSGADLSAFLLWYGVTVSDEFSRLALSSPPVVGIAITDTADSPSEVVVEGLSASIDQSVVEKTSVASTSVQPPPYDPMTSIGIPLSTLEEIWHTCEGVHCEAQKPLFQAEKEAEKALAFLEKIPFAQLAGTLLSAAMHFVYRVLDAKLNQWILSAPVSAPVSPGPALGRTRTGSGSQPMGSPRGSGRGYKFSGGFSTENLTASLVGDLALLKEQIASAVQQLKQLSSLPLTAVRDEEALSAVVILVDSVAGLVEKLENVCLKADELDMLFKGVVLSPNAATVTKGSNSHISGDLHRMLVALSLRDNYFAERDEEASLLMDFIKVVSVRSGGGAGEASTTGPTGSHAWHSYDGRELGVPTSKSYSLRLGGAPTSIASSSGKHAFETLSSASRGESLDFVRNQSDGNEDVSQTQQSSSSGGSSVMVSDFQMDAVIEQSSLRVSFRVPERVD